uniref:Uncharacterized protein n=1 Tax=Ixodes ricinus TaxID=34613 RepID=A0A0K8R3Y9_IXORI
MKKRVHFETQQDIAFPNITVQDVRNIAGFFEIDVSSRRLTLPGSVFARLIGQRIISKMSEITKIPEAQKDYVKRMYANVPNLKCPDSTKAAITYFSEWLTNLYPIDNLISFLNMDGSLLLR